MISLKFDHIYSHLDFRLQLDVQQKCTHETGDYHFISGLFVVVVFKYLLAYVEDEYHLENENEDYLFEV